MDKVPPPLCTLRGHGVAVTALASFKFDDVAFLVSGDQEGSIKVWDLGIYREYHSFKKHFSSRIQSIKVLHADSRPSILVVQTRDEGVKLISINEIIKSKDIIIVHDYSAYESLFSRADAINISEKEYILAHPSSLENHLVTIRLLDANGATKLSGSAKRFELKDSKKCSIFDLLLTKKNLEYISLFVGYEDGCLAMFSINVNDLKIVLVKVFDFAIGDFVSAFDVNVTESELCNIVCGSPQRDVIFATYSKTLNEMPEPKKIPLARQGVACIRIRPDAKLFAVSCWDDTVRLYSMKTCKPLAVLDNHLKQVQDILFVDSFCDQPSENGTFSHQTGLGKYLLCCASQDGTISISLLY